MSNADRLLTIKTIVQILEINGTLKFNGSFHVWQRVRYL